MNSDGQLRDYAAWHRAYDDPASALSARLRCVQAEIDAWLDRTPGRVRVVSACAGEGRDMLGALARRDDRSRVSGTLIEILDPVADAAQRTIDELGLEIEVRRADAGTTDAYVGAVPADLVLLSGIMGNISAEDNERLIMTSRSFCSPGATMLWTRGSMAPDRGPEIRRWCDAAGYERVALHEAIEGTPMRVGVERLVAQPTPLNRGQRLFTFLR